MDIADLGDLAEMFLEYLAAVIDDISVFSHSSDTAKKIITFFFDNTKLPIDNGEFVCLNVIFKL